VAVAVLTTGELNVVICYESQAIGFARKMLLESRLAEPWFLILRDEKGPLVRENGDRDRECRTLTSAEFVPPDGRAIEIVASYVPGTTQQSMAGAVGL
jgi:hypothetical protein